MASAASLTARPKDADILFVGGGPVGLWTASQIKARRPDLNVTILERHSKYQRKHVLIINPKSFDGMVDHPRLREFAEMVKKTNTIATSCIESELKSIARGLGVKIVRKRVKAPEKLKDTYKKAKLIVGADGAHSLVRQKIFNDELSEKKTLSHIIEVKYETEGAGNQTPFSVRCCLKHLSASWLSEHVGKRRENGKTPITIRLAVSQREYNKIKSTGKATFKKPLILESEEGRELIPSRIQKTIDKWFETKKKLFNENASNVKITATNLDVYRSKSFEKMHAGASYALVGDAAFGVPFFRSLNNGLLCGTNLAKQVADEPQMETAAKKYSEYATSLSKKQIAYAKTKGGLLNVYDKGIGIFSKITPLPFKEWLINLVVTVIQTTRKIFTGIQSFFKQNHSPCLGQASNTSA